MNTQPIEKQTQCPESIEVHSLFRTIQGEGPYVGRPSIFVRLAGCNLQCPGCDTEYTAGRIALSPDALIASILDIALDGDLIVITGGEPFRQDISILVKELTRTHHREVQVETNGTLFLPTFPYRECTIVCAPKAGKVNAQLAGYIDAYKYVINHRDVLEDGLPGHVLGHPASPRVARPHELFKGAIYVQPEDAKDPEVNALNLAATISSCMTHGYTFCLQVHKIINLE